ncbi:response regulator transcription factor [Paenibacillus tarimensis]|uniref:response regulator transcription factor n=1 Tax=Paenibacillus tarimensis TaxID=416012 RepID=UPI001F443644|nr:response regulator transcription factor [Paenibacillus tarimensis]MCF2942168.1 response regulator transcription factor [Paenibacillus tarimensis]
MINVLIADDDPFIRESLKVILDLDPELHVAAVCSNGEEAARTATGHAGIDVVLMDIRMPVCDGVKGTKMLKALGRPPAVLILTTFDDDDYIAEAIRNGANGYLLKNVPPARIIAGIKTVHQGEMLVHPDIARKLAGMIGVRTDASGANQSDTGWEEHAAKRLRELGLTPAEQTIVRHIAEGQSNKEIAAALFLSEGTIKNYISEILGKLELRDRTQIAIFYLKMKP